MDGGSSEHHGPGGPVFVLHDQRARLEPHPETSHTEHGVTLLLDGWFRMVHGRPIRVQADTLTVVPAGVPHTPLEGESVDYWLVGFCASCMGLDESQVLMSPFHRVRHGALPVVTVSKGRRRRLVQLFRQLGEECGRTTPETPELTRSLLSLLLGEVHRAMPHTGASEPSGTLVSEALQFIQQRCLDPISLKDVARAVHRTPAHVAAAVKQATGYSVGDWISAGRVAEAATRLRHTDDSLERVAADVGWKDKTHFIRRFRRAYGMTPAAWRREVRRPR